MRLHRSLVRGIVAAAIVLGAFSVFAQQHGDRPEFTRLPSAQPTDTAGKVEVIEFFWYGCPHCYKVEPAVEAWEKRMPKDAVLRREHVVWDGRRDIEGHARLFLTLRAMGLLKQHHQAVFNAIHGEKQKLASDAEIFAWVAKRGIDRAKFEAAYKSFGVNAQVGRARSLTRNYGVESVPTFAVNGKYLTSLSGARSEQRLFEVIDKLITDERPRK